MRLKLSGATTALLTIAFIAEAQVPPPEGSLGKRIDAVFEDVISADAPGLAALVRKNGQVIFERCYGLRDLRTRAKIDARTNFRLASFTKQFTAMAIMLLVHEGRLRYDTPLPGVFPDFPPYGKAITVRNLLNHTSGLPDYEDLMSAAEKVQGPTWTSERQIQDDEVMALLKREKAGKFAPGTGWSYSNSGYVVLGLIVAKVAGIPFGQFMQDRIFAPLKMHRTIVSQKRANELANRAVGHTKIGLSFTETDQSATSDTLGDGGIYSNLEDLARWDGALTHYTLLSKEEMQAALAPVRLMDGSEPRWPREPGEDNLNPGKPVSYGFGWFLDPYQGRRRMWHTGTTMGFRTVIERFTESHGLSVVILCNRADLHPDSLALRVAALTEGRSTD